MRGLDDDRGAVAVMVAILMVALIGFAAIGVDVANMAADKQQLQNGADAAALAIAETCAAGTCDESFAQTLAEQNKRDGEVIQLGVSYPLTNVVKVVAGDDTEHWFAGIWEITASRITAESMVKWGAPLSSHADLPLAISSGLVQCLVDDPLVMGASGSVFEEVEPGVFQIVGEPDETPIEIFLPNYWDGNGKAPEEGEGGCVIDTHWTPGGYGWLDPVNSTTCSASTSVGLPAPGDPGVSPPQPACKSSDMQPYVGKTVLIPFFENPPEQPGDNAEFLIEGYVAFHVVGFNWPAAVSDPAPSCSKCLVGYFTKAPALDGSGDDDLTNTGVVTIELILDLEG